LANNDVVTVVMTSNASCASPSIATSNAVTMTVNAAVTPALSIVAVSNPICSGGNFSLTATPSNGGSSPTYQWRKNGTNISGGTGLTYSTTSAVNGDVFTCVMTSNNACQTSSTATSNGITAQVSNSITPTSNITASSTSVCTGGSVTFTGTVTGGGSSPFYQWKKNGVNISGATSIDYTTSSIANNDVFSLQLTSNAGCVSTSVVTSNAVTMSVLSAVTYYLDEDADGFGISSASISTCSIPSGYSVNSNDCNDNDNTINPGVNEQCWNQLDDNCNGAVDENCAILGCVDPVACNFNPQANQSDNSCQYPPNYYNCEGNCIVDTDGDGVCDQLEVLGCTLSNACNFNPLATELDGSCILPQPEICNGIDDNCNGLTDEGVTVNSVTAVNAITKLYPTCSGSNMLAANLNLGSNSPITEGDGLDLWYRLTAQRNSLRAALSAATGVNAVEIYQQE
jgi:hypothetical protein